MINTRNKRDKTRNTKSKKIERERKKNTTNPKFVAERHVYRLYWHCCSRVDDEQVFSETDTEKSKPLNRIRKYENAKAPLAVKWCTSLTSLLPWLWVTSKPEKNRQSRSIQESSIDEPSTLRMRMSGEQFLNNWTSVNGPSQGRLRYVVWSNSRNLHSFRVQMKLTNPICYQNDN